MVCCRHRKLDAQTTLVAKDFTTVAFIASIKERMATKAEIAELRFSLELHTFRTSATGSITSGELCEPEGCRQRDRGDPGGSTRDSEGARHRRSRPSRGWTRPISAHDKHAHRSREFLPLKQVSHHVNAGVILHGRTGAILHQS
jgi:hypothetical protein